jgi:hypothetical protein
LPKENDSVIYNSNDIGDDIYGRIGTEVVVFEPEQIHILGSKKDIDGFKEFVATKSKPAEVKPTMSPAILDASVKTAHLRLMSVVIGEKGLLGARDLITTFPSLDGYKAILGPIAKFYTQDELRQIYNGNKKYINSFIAEFEKPIEENTTGIYDLTTFQDTSLFEVIIDHHQKHL